MQNCSSVDGPVISRSRPTLAISRDSPALCASPQPKSSEYLLNLFFLSILFPAPGGPRKPAPPAKRENTPASPPILNPLFRNNDRSCMLQTWPFLRAFPEENGVDKLGLYLKFFNATEKFRPHDHI